MPREPMRVKWIFSSALICALAALLCPRAIAQGGSIEFVAHATPSGGTEEPVRGFPFYLLSKSFADVNAEADHDNPSPDMDKFIDSLTVSKELKAWMKKNHWVALSGLDFTNKVQADDVMTVPEFFKVYTDRESSDQTAHFPQLKVKPTDKDKYPDRYKAAMDLYRDQVRRYLMQFPDTIEGIDIGLDDVNPEWKWNEMQLKWKREQHGHILGLVQSKYVVARTETDLQGQGFFRGVSPGTYWLSTLDVSANVGDSRSYWDVPVTVQPGTTAYSVLSDANVSRPAHEAP
jgi:hypothetical protein